MLREDRGDSCITASANNSERIGPRAVGIVQQLAIQLVVIPLRSTINKTESLEFIKHYLCNILTNAMISRVPIANGGNPHLGALSAPGVNVKANEEVGRYGLGKVRTRS